MEERFGWTCPRCHTVWAPHIDRCSNDHDLDLDEPLFVAPTSTLNSTTPDLPAFLAPKKKARTPTPSGPDEECPF